MAGKVGLLGGRKVRGYIEHGKMLLHKMQAKGIHRADGRRRCKSSCWRRRLVLPGWARTLPCARRAVMSARSLAAAAFVKVMISSESASAGCSGSVDKPQPRARPAHGSCRAGSRRHQQAAAPCPDGSRLRRGELSLGLFWHGVSPSCTKSFPLGGRRSHSANGSSLIEIVRSCSPSRWVQAQRKSQ